jgi:hypothetical protein
MQLASARGFGATPPGTRVPAGARPSPILGSLPARDPPRYLDPCRQLPSRARVHPSKDAIDAWVRTVRAIEDHHSWAPIRPRLATDQASTQWRSLHLVPTTRHRQLDTGSSTPAAQPVPARLPTAATTRRGSADGVRRMRTSWCARPARFAVRSPSPRGPRAAERSAPRGRSRRRSAGDHPGWRTR